MNILFYAPADLSTLNRGTPLRIYALYKELCKHYTVHLVANKAPQELLGTFAELPKRTRGFGWWQTTRFLKQQIALHNTDVLFGNTHNSLLPTVLAGKSIATCVDLHGLPAAELGKQGIKAWLQNAIDAMLINRLTGFTAVCTPLKERYSKTKGMVLYGGANCTLIAEREPIQLETNDPVIVYTGNTRAYQGIHTLLEALSNLQTTPWHLLMICSDATETVQKLLRQFNVQDRATILPAQEQAIAFSYVKGADIAVVPRPSSQITEFAFASKLPEFMATGTPVIATGVADTHLLIEPPSRGWLAEPGNVQSLQEVLKTVLTLPQDERSAVGTKAQKWVQQNLDWPALGDKLAVYLKTLIHD